MFRNIFSLTSVGKFVYSNINYMVLKIHIDFNLSFQNHLCLGVTSREVVRLFLEQLRFDFVPVFHGLQGRFAA